MQRSVLNVNDLHVESFELDSPRNERAAPNLLNTRTMAPKDCPETLPRFC
jgi:hypothetical protein